MKQNKISRAAVVFTFVFLSVILISAGVLAITVSSSQGPNSGSTFADDSSAGALVWSNPDSAQASDSAYATATSSGPGPQTSHYLKASGFGFSIPAGAIINGIEVQVERKTDSTSVKDSGVFLVKDGVIDGVNHAATSGSGFTADGNWTKNSETTITYGGPTDLWGLSLTPSDINDAATGLVFAALRTYGTGGRALDVNYISMTVYYTPDTTPPTTTASALNYGDYSSYTFGTWTNQPVAVTLTCNDGSGSGCSDIFYSIDGSPFASVSGSSVLLDTFVNTDSSGFPISIVHTVTYYSTDNAENPETPKSVQVMIDASPPTTTDNVPAGWQNNPTVTLTCNDGGGDVSGCSRVYYTTDGIDPTTDSTYVDSSSNWQFTFPSDGQYPIAYFGVDNAGNQESAVNYATLMVDTTAPVIGGMQNNNYWWNTDFDFILTDVNAAVSGMQSAQYRIDCSGEWQSFSPWTPPGRYYTSMLSVSSIGDGIHTLDYTLTDNAGNTNTGSASLWIDTTAPETTITPIEVPYEFGTWTDHNVYVRLSCSDGSGDVSQCASLNYLINGVQPAQLTSAGALVREVGVSDEYLTFNQPGYYNITYYSTDNAGNVENLQSRIVKILGQGPAGIGGEFEFPDGESPDNATSVTVHGDLTVIAGNSSITLKDGTVISKADGSKLDINDLTAEEDNNSVIFGLASGYGVVGNVLQWGIKDNGLNFDPAIKVSIYVGLAYENQTLYIQRSVSGSGDWTTEGLQQTTCFVTDGLCNFTTIKASYFSSSTYTAPPASAASSGGGGGGSSSSCTTQWNCTAWSTCAGGVQTRTCSYPAVNCAPMAIKPVQSQTCTSASTTGTTPETTAQTTNGGTAPITGGVIGALGTGGSIAIIVFIIAVLGGATWLTVRARRKKTAVN